MNAAAETLIPWTHDRSLDGGCRGIALYSTRRLEPGEVIAAHVFRKMDGGQPREGDAITCETCGDFVSLKELTQGEAK